MFVTRTSSVRLILALFAIITIHVGTSAAGQTTAPSPENPRAKSGERQVAIFQLRSVNAAQGAAILSAVFRARSAADNQPSATATAITDDRTYSLLVDGSAAEIALATQILNELDRDTAFFGAARPAKADADVDARLREMEIQLQSLLKEIKNLKSQLQAGQPGAANAPAAAR